MRILQRNLKRTTDTFLFISHTTNVILFKFRCNNFISVRIIKEMPGSVASGTRCNIPADTTPLTTGPTSQLSNIPRRQTSAMSDGVVRISRELTVCRRVCFADYDGSAQVRQASRSSQFCDQTYSNHPILIAALCISSIYLISIPTDAHI